MIRIIAPVRGRWVFVCLLGLQAHDASAAAGWDCRRSTDGKEWVCSAGKAKPGTPSEIGGAPARTEPVQPSPAKELAKEKAVRPEPEKPLAEMARPEPRLEAAEEPEMAERPGTESASEAQEIVSEERPAGSESQESEEEETRAVTLKRLPGVTAPTLEQASPPKPLAKSSASPGWSCKSGADQQWDCGLVGPDPRGEAHPVGQEGESAANWAESSTITAQDESRFRTIMGHLPDDPWRLTCGKHKSEITPSTLFMLTREDELAREKAPLEIHSDSAELLHGEVSNFQGTADMARADQKLFGDFVTHNNESGTLNAQGDVFYREKGLSFASDTAFLRLNTDQGVLRNSQFVIETVPARGTSRRTTIDSKYLTRYEKVTYTTCPPANQDWLMHASTAKINKETGRGFAKNAWMEFKGVPFFYTPFMSFPVDDRRQSGFLTPTIGYSKVNGFNFVQPYYFNLAPNYDATFTPRVLSNRGMLYRGEFRYMTDWTRGSIQGEYMPHDDIKGDSRGLFAFRNRSRFTKNLNSNLQIFRVSDDTYLNELGNLLNVPRSLYLRSFGNLNYSGAGFTTTVAGDYYQLVDQSTTTSPYARLPQLTFNYGHSVFGSGLQFQGLAELVNFYNTKDVVQAQRLNLRPRLYYPLQGPAGFVTPSVALQQTEYWLDRSLPDSSGSTSSSRTAPIFSLDSGLNFEREFQLGSVGMQQTVEPRLFYLYIPKINQDDLPIFDSAKYDFNFYQLFRENRFVGTDRLGDSNQLTGALTTRFIDQESGLERLKLSLGEIFYFQSREVQLNRNSSTQSTLNVSPETSSLSNLVAEASSMITDNWSFKSVGQWNPDLNRIGRGQVGFFYNNRRNDLFSVSYRYLSDPNNQSQVKVNLADVGFRLPFAEGWHLIGQWQYSILDDLTTQAIVGVEKENCCYKLSLVGLHYLNNVSSNGVAVASDKAESNNTLFFMLELKGLTRLGDHIDQFLSRNLRGYRLENEF